MRFKTLLLITSASVLLFTGACRNKKVNTAGSKDSVCVYYEFHDFESVLDPRLDSTKGSSGRKSGLLNDKIEYGFGMEKHFKEISSFRNIDEVNVSFKCWMDKKYPDATFVLSIDDLVTGKNILWEGKPFVTAKFNEWSPVTINYKINQKFLQPEYLVKLYIWNKGKNIFNFDDFSVSFVQKKR
jgi:hypothetical protein